VLRNGLVGGQVAFDGRIQTDPERFWDHYQAKILPRVYDNVVKVTGGKPTADKQPFFRDFDLEVWMSEPDERIGIDEELVSSLPTRRRGPTSRRSSRATCLASTRRRRWCCARWCGTIASTNSSCRLTPTSMLHAGRYSALGMDITSRAAGLLPEAEVEGRLWRQWLPDIYLNPHGYPSHEWVQPFSGYVAPGFRGYWTSRGWYTMLSSLRDPRAPEQVEATAALREAIVPESPRGSR
jgi:hypothetical protein